MRFAGCGTEESEPWLSQTMPSVRPRACPTPAFIGYRRIANRSRRYRRATASARPAVERRKRPCDGRCCSRCCRSPLSSAAISMSPAACHVDRQRLCPGRHGRRVDRRFRPGREVDVHDNQEVTKGEVLFRLDPLQFQLALDRANAQLASTGDDLRTLQASYRNCWPKSSRPRRTSTSTRSTFSASSS